MMPQQQQQQMGPPMMGYRPMPAQNDPQAYPPPQAQSYQQQQQLPPPPPPMQAPTQPQQHQPQQFQQPQQQQPLSPPMQAPTQPQQHQPQQFQQPQQQLPLPPPLRHPMYPKPLAEASPAGAPQQQPNYYPGPTNNNNNNNNNINQQSANMSPYAPPHQQQQQPNYYPNAVPPPLPTTNNGQQSNMNSYPPPQQPNYYQNAGPQNNQQSNLNHYPQPQIPRPAPVKPESLPSVATLISSELDSYQANKTLVFKAPATLPPLVTTLESQQLKPILQDGGCARPCHMRSTIYQVPTTKDMLKSTHMQFSVVVKPFDDGEVEGNMFVPLSLSEITRCNRCRAYLNPFTRNGQCCICNFSFGNIQDLDHQRPELHCGSYEFRVSTEYYRNQIAETRRPHIIFAIEMTAHSRHLIDYLSKNLAEIIKNYFPTDHLYTTMPCPLVGFVTYNSKITVYDVLDGGHAYIISDMTSDCPSTSKFLVDPNENYAEIEKFLSSLPELCQEQLEQEQQTVLGPVLEAALKTCMFDTSNLFNGDQKKAPNPKVVPAGKVYVLHSSLPTFGDDRTPGRLGAKRNIDDLKRQLGTDNESKTLAPEGKYYSELAQKCISDYASGVELFFFPPHPRAYLNISTLGEMSRLTGSGVINKYHRGEMDNFKKDLQMSLKSTMGFDAAMRIRTSTGVSPVKYIGNFSELVSASNLEMACVNTNSNFIVNIEYDDKLQENDLVVVQFAMIYTSVCGERRVRVHNLALNTCNIHHDLFKSSCCDTLMNVLMRETIEKMRAGSLFPKAAKEQLTTRVTNILASYRKYCTENQSNPGQLILPEALKLLPVYLCGALKCDAIDGGSEMFPDDKVLAQLNLLGSLPSKSQATLYPRMYAIDACDATDEENESGYAAVLTRCYNLAIEEAKGQCYILENGHYLFVFFPNTELGQSFLTNVYGVRKDDTDLIWDLRQKEATESVFLEDLIDQITRERRRALRICVVRQSRDKMESVFKTFLYEEKKRPEGAAVSSKLDNASYVDVLCYLHNEIRAKMSQ